MGRAKMEDCGLKHGIFKINKPLICMPILAEDIDSLLEQAAEAARHCPDLIEWRADGFDWSEGTGGMQRVLQRVKQETDGIPLIFTLRRKEEGGLCSLPEDHRLDIIGSAVKSGLLGYCDIELSTGIREVKELKELAGRHGTKVILSFHDFSGTPEEGLLIETMKRARDLGADIAKVAVTARDMGDVLSLLGACHRAASEGLGIPVSVMAMGKLGAFSRIAAGFFGSEIVYASGRAPTAPGQVPVGQLRRLWEILYDNCDGRDLDDNCNEYPCD